MTPLEHWIEEEARIAAPAMLRAFSREDLVKERPGFGQTIRAARGAVIASPVLASYDPDPDYFFHWFRDSAVVIEALRLLHADGRVGREALGHVGDFARFNLSLSKLDGRALVAKPQWREKVVPDFQKFVRDDHDLSGAHGDAIAAETRVNPDGTLDISKWARPQHDGPPLRALAALRWVRDVPFGPEAAADLAALIRSDLDFTRRHWREASFDIWEEEKGLHYYTLRVSAAALTEGAAWLEKRSVLDVAADCRAQAATILEMLDGFWEDGERHYRSRILEDGRRSAKELDIAVILSAIHALGDGERHTVRDLRMHATLSRLEAIFEADYPINRDRPPGRGIAMGRYRGDVYYSGGAYYFSSLGAAEFCYLAAHDAQDRAAWKARGDAYLETVRAYTPADGQLSEQFDQKDGHQTSARHLAWSYAAFLSCVEARRRLGG